MAVLFSAVTITSDSDQAEFLVAGVPKSYDYEKILKECIIQCKIRR